MARMTKAQLEQELKNAIEQRDAVMKDLSKSQKQLDEKLTNTELWDKFCKQIKEYTQQRDMAIKQRDRYRAKAVALEAERHKWWDNTEQLNSAQKKLGKLQNAYYDGVQKLTEAEATIDQLRGDNILLKAQNEALQKQLDELKAKYAAEHIHNARKAGRKQALESDQRNELVAMRENGHTFEEIGKHFGITKVGALKIYNREKAKETN